MAEVHDSAFTQRLWARAADDITPADRAHLNDLIIDTIAIAGHARKFGVGATRVDLAALEPLRAGGASVWGKSALTQPMEAAFLNGTAAEVLDFQEVLIDGRNNGHAAVVAVPALLALAEARAVPLDRLHKALRLALASNVMLLRALGRGHREGDVGFRTTSLGAPVATAFAAGYLLELGFERACQALAIASCSLPAGLLAAMDPEVSTFSTDKDTSVGLSAQHAVQSVLLAEQGATGPGAALTGRRGWLTSYGFGTAEVAQLDMAPEPGLLDRYQIKRFPVNFGCQAAVRAALDLADGLEVDEIEKVVVRVKTSSAQSLRTRHLTTHVAARFSLVYAVASALCRKRSILEDFGEAAIGDVAVSKMMAKTVLAGDATMEATHRQRGIFPGQVDIRDSRGTLHTRAFDGPWEGLAVDERRQLLHAKWRSLVGTAATNALRQSLDIAGNGAGRIDLTDAMLGMV